MVHLRNGKVYLNKDFYYCSNDKLEKLYDSKYEIIDINKPLYSASHYKVKEIQEMAQKLQLDQEDLKKKWIIIII